MSRDKVYAKGIDIGALITLLTLSMYVLGFLKLAVLYAAIDCFWAIKFNSAQDFILQGATGVSVAFFSAMLFSWGRDPDKALDGSMRVIAVIGFFWLLIAILISKYLFIGKLMLAVTGELFPYALMGPVFYALFSTYSRDGFRKGAGRYLLGCFIIVFMGLFVYQDEKSKEIDDGFGPTYMLSKNSGDQKSILIGSVNGKYLARSCGEKRIYSIIESGADWIVSPIQSAHDCK